MRWLKTVFGEILGLFVDDGSFALSIVVWLVLAWLLLPRLEVPETAKGLVLFVGLAGILATSALLKAGK
jgi:hypothetical protein